jgi:hypothetical protein
VSRCPLVCKVEAAGTQEVSHPWVSHVTPVPPWPHRHGGGCKLLMLQSFVQQLISTVRPCSHFATAGQNNAPWPEYRVCCTHAPAGAQRGRLLYKLWTRSREPPRPYVPAGRQGVDSWRQRGICASASVGREHPGVPVDLSRVGKQGSVAPRNRADRRPDRAGATFTTCIAARASFLQCRTSRERRRYSPPARRLLPLPEVRLDERPSVEAQDQAGEVHPRRRRPLLPLPRVPLPRPPFRLVAPST